jgi:acid phosphatase family membrane protein YuiD
MFLTGNKVNLISLTRSGGMPSSHSALITAITLSMGLKNGFNSSHFFLAVALSLVVIYDARGIRHTVGQHAKILNQTVMPQNAQKLNEHTGHTFPEIIAGICIGIIISLAMYNLISF